MNRLRLAVVLVLLGDLAQQAHAAPPTLAQVHIAPDRSAIAAAVQFFHRTEGSTLLRGRVHVSTCRDGVGVLYASTLDAAGEPDPVEVMLSGGAYADDIARALCARLKEATQ